MKIIISGDDWEMDVRVAVGIESFASNRHGNTANSQWPWEGMGR